MHRRRQAVAKSGKQRKRSATSESVEAIAVAVDTVRQLEDRLAAARKEHARRLDKLASAKAAKDRQKVAKRRRQVDEAMKEVAAISDRLAQLAGSVAATPTIVPPDATDASNATDAAAASKATAATSAATDAPARSARRRRVSGRTAETAPDEAG